MSEVEIKCPICDGWFNVDTINGRQDKYVSEYAIYRDVMNLLKEPYIYKTPEGKYGFEEVGYKMEIFDTYDAADKMARRMILVDVKNFIDKHLKSW